MSPHHRQSLEVSETEWSERKHYGSQISSGEYTRGRECDGGHSEARGESGDVVLLVAFDVRQVLQKKKKRIGVERVYVRCDMNVLLLHEVLYCWRISS